MLRPSQSQAFHLFRKHVHGAVVLGKFAFHQYERLTAHCRTTAVVDIGPHDHVRHSRFVFYQHEDDSFGRLWSLAGNDQPSDLTFDAGFQILQIAIERQVRW